MRHSPFVKSVACFVAWLTLPGDSGAQSPVSFPTGPVAFAPSAAPQTVLFQPLRGAGPWSAVVLLPSCGGVSSALYDWAKRLTDWGWLALILDSNTPRRVTNNCQGAHSPVTQRHIAEDTAAALAYLRSLPMAKADRLAVVGFSWGAMVGAKLSGGPYQAGLAPPTSGLRAIAAFYPGCGTSNTNAPPHVVASYEWGGKVVTPLMLFLGAKDDDTPPGFCTDRADRARSLGQPVTYRVYPDAAHAFDVSVFGTQGRQVKLSGNRGTSVYRYSPAATEAAEADLRAFLGQYLD